MEINNYTVVSCANCEEVWIVEGNPERSQCPRCEKTRKFKLLKKYRSYDDIEKARIVRAKVKAAIGGNEDGFNQAFEDGSISAKDIDIFSGSRFSKNQSKSFDEIVKEGISKSDTIDEVVEYCEQRGYGEEKVKKYIEKKKVKGDIIQSGNSIRFV